MMKKLFCLLILSLSLAAYGQTNALQLDTAIIKRNYLSSTKYDWSKIVAPIVQGKTTQQEKFYAIYRWLCENISYDTSYSIYYADECYEKRTGVCNAYAEMFCRMAQGAGLRAEKVNGLSKDMNGNPNGSHAWNMAYLDNGKTLLIDATWGAGYVNGKTFTRAKKNDTWFDVHPKWMIFTHFPEDSQFQAITPEVTYEQYASWPFYKPFMALYGCMANDIFNAVSQGRTPNLPVCYEVIIHDKIKRLRIPLTQNLKSDKKYRFTITTDARPDEVIFIHSANSNQGEWRRMGKTLVCDYTPGDVGGVYLCIANGHGSFDVIAEYKVIK